MSLWGPHRCIHFGYEVKMNVIQTQTIIMSSAYTEICKWINSWIILFDKLPGTKQEPGNSVVII